MQKVIVASNNKGKIAEIKSILGDKFEFISLKEAGIDVDVVEDGKDFFANALKKAKEIYDIAKIPVIADDSGLCVNVLFGFPGVNTKRFLGENSTDRQRNEYILKKLEDMGCRSATVECCLVYYYAEGRYERGIGTIEGNISLECRGDNGFGFDEIFELPNGKTLAELSSSEKNKVSARYLAAIDLNNNIEENVAF